MKEHNTLSPVMVIYLGARAPQAGSFINHLTEFNGTLYFTALVDQNKGVRLWKIDENGWAVTIKELAAGVRGATPDHLTTVSDILYFTASDGKTSGAKLWKIDKTGVPQTVNVNMPEGKVKRKRGIDIKNLTNINGTLYFVADGGVYGQELWKLDETDTPVMVKNWRPGRFLISGFSDLTYVNGNLYFIIHAGMDKELWKIDEAGKLEKIEDTNNQYGNLTVLKNTLYFTNNPKRTGYRWWKIDESGAPVLATDINPNKTFFPDNLIDFNGTIYFSANGGSEKGIKLWKVDETGTPVLVIDINPTGSSFPQGFTNINGTLYFNAKTDENSFNLWKSDGTSNGTVLVRDVNGNGVRSANNFIDFNGTLYFLAYSKANGNELWKSDGTNEGTKMVMDINPEGSSMPCLFTVVGDTLYFVANDGKHGQRLWKLTSPATPTIPPSTYAYIPNQDVNAVSVVNLSSEKFGQTEVSIPVGESPGTVAVSPDNARVYIGNGGDQTLSVIDTYTNTVRHTFSVSGLPLAVAVSPDNTRVVVTTRDPGSINNPMLRIFDAKTFLELQAFSVGYDPDAIAIAFDGTIYIPGNDISSNGNVHVFKMNAAGTYEQEADLAVGAISRPEGIAILEKKSDSKIYVAAKTANGGQIIVVSPASNTILKTINFANKTVDVVLSPNGSKVYVAEESNSQISIIDTATDELSSAISSLCSFPGGMSISQDGSALYVSDPGSDEVAHLNLETNAWSSDIKVGSNPVSRGNFIAGPIPKQEEEVPDSALRAYVPIVEESQIHSDGHNVLAKVNMNTKKVEVYTHAVATNSGGDQVGPANSEVSLDGNQVMLSFADSKTIAVVNTLTNRVEKTFELDGEVVDMEFHPDGYQLYVSTNSATKMATIDLGNKLVIPFDMGLTAEIRSLFFSADGKKLFGIQDSPSGFVAGNPTAHSSNVYPLAGETIVDAVLAPAGNLVYLSTQNGSIKTINTSDGTAGSWEMTGLGEIAAIAIHPGGNALYYINAADKRLYSIDIAGKTKTLITRVGMNSKCMQISTDGNTMYVLDGGNKYFIQVDLTATPPVTPTMINLEGQAIGCGRFVRG